MLDRDTGWSVAWHEEMKLWCVYDQWGNFARAYKKKVDCERYLEWICGAYVERHYLSKGA